MAEPALRIENLRKSFPDPEGGTFMAVDLPRLQVETAESLVVRGESGSGKTTLLNLVAGILPPDSGLIEIAGERMSGRSETARDRLRARHIGYLFQTFNLLPGLTALENVQLGMTFRPRRGQAPREAARAALDRMGLADRMHHRPHQLSVGQQQRVAIARALAGHPTLVLADEPTSNLDRARAEQCMDLLTSFASECGAALLVVTHDEALIGRFDRCETLHVAAPVGAHGGDA
jgi:putative ABC transport system ATP-binding protein